MVKRIVKKVKTTKPRKVRARKLIKDKKLNEFVCLGMTVKQIKRTPEYKGLTPLGKQNKSGSYKHGNKSTMRKANLCEALSNPQKYHLKIAKLKSLKKNAGPRKRATRTGACLVAKRKVPCNNSVYKYQGITTTGSACCYKKKQSAKTIAKRLANATSVMNKRRSPPKKRGRPAKVPSLLRPMSASVFNTPSIFGPAKRPLVFKKTRKPRKKVARKPRKVALKSRKPRKVALKSRKPRKVVKARKPRKTVKSKK